MRDGGASRLDRYLAFRESLWSEFAALVRRGGVFPELFDVTCPRGMHPPGLGRTTQGDSWFYAKRLVADPDYVLHLGEDLIVATGEVTFEDADGVLRRIEPDILDLYWLSEMLDHAR